jgi:hypothetical protein
MQRKFTNAAPMAVALVALFVALGGTGSAASRSAVKPKGSYVTAAQVTKLVSKYIAKHRAELEGPAGETGATGGQGPQGTAGVMGNAGAPGTVVAYATINAAGTVVSGNGKLTVTSDGTGVYCVSPTTASGIDATSVEPVVTPDYQGSSGGHDNTAQFDSNGGGACGGGWEIVVENNGVQADTGLSILVP